LANVGIRAALRVVRVGVPILDQEVMKCKVEFVFTDIVSQGVHDLTALLIPDVGFILDEYERTFPADLASTSAGCRWR
jgi:hypothetical protein